MISRPQITQISLISVLVVAIIVMAIVNLLIGSVRIPVTDICCILLGDDSHEIWTNIIWKSRLPQALTAIVAGAGLAVSGLQMQTVFRNPLAGPSVLGISNGSALGVAFVVLLSGRIGGVALSRLGYLGDAAMSVAAIIGALAVMLLILWIAQKVKGNVTLLIIGVMIGYLANAIIGVLKFLSPEEDVKAFVVWGLGSFSRVSGDEMVLFVVLMCILLPLTCLLVKPMNILLLGDRYAANQTGSHACDYFFWCAGGYRYCLLWTYHVHWFGSTPPGPCHLPHQRPSAADACHRPLRSSLGIGL